MFLFKTFPTLGPILPPKHKEDTYSRIYKPGHKTQQTLKTFKLKNCAEKCLTINSFWRVNFFSWSYRDHTHSKLMWRSTRYAVELCDIYIIILSRFHRLEKACKVFCGSFKLSTRCVELFRQLGDIYFLIYFLWNIEAVNFKRKVKPFLSGGHS